MTTHSRNESTPTLSPPWTASILLLVLLIGTGIRLWMIGQATPPDFAVDKLFDGLGWHLATGRGFTLDGETPSAHVGPAYPAVLAIFYGLFGHRPDWVPYLHVLFDALAALCVYGATGLLFDRRVATLAAVAVYMYPAYWTFDLRIRSESLLTLMVSAWLWAAVSCATSKQGWKYALSGIAAGLTVLCKPVVIPIALLLALAPAVSFRLNRDMLARTALYLSCLLLVVLPWTMRNYHAFGTFIPISSGVGAGLWMGSDPISQGSWPMPLTMESQIWATAGMTPLPYAHVMFEVAADRALKQRGLARVRDNPLQYLRLVLVRGVHFWIGNQYYLLNGDSGLVSGFQQDVQARGALVASYSLVKRMFFIPGVLLLAVWAGWRLRARWQEILPLYAFPVGLTLGYIPFSVEAGRYLLPVLPCVFILAVIAIFLLRPEPHWLKVESPGLVQARS